jgi:polyhydroxyalkanoate synthesis regulator phasin
MAAKSRKTDVASLLESYLDEHEDELSPNMFSGLDDLAEEIDDAAEELHEEIDDLKEEVADLKNQIKELEMN